MMRGFTTLLLCAFLLLGNSTFSQEKVIALKAKKETSLATKQCGSSINFEVSFNDLKVITSVAKSGDSYADLSLPNGISYGDAGMPSLPAIKRLIKLPIGSTPTIKVKSYSVQEINLSQNGVKNLLRPVQPSLRKDQEEGDVPFKINKKVYATDQFVLSNIATVNVLGVMRGVQVAQVIINPVNYNPVSGVVQVYNDIDVEVTFNAGAKGAEDIPNYSSSPYFDATYGLFSNKQDEKTSGTDYPSHPDLTKYPVRMLIVADSMFESTLKPFIEWKTMKGFNVEVAYTDVIGTTKDLIKTYIHGVYNSATDENPAPTFLVLVGDVQQVPASATGSSSEKKTDLYYASVDGDIFPEMYYGRMSAQNTTQLKNIIDKILYYEKYQFADPTYLNRATLIAGADASWNPHVGQPTIKYGTANYFKATEGYTSVYEYGVSMDVNNDSEISGYTGCYADDRFRVGYMNYTAHCSETTWGNPLLTISALNAVDNTNMYPLAVGNCCLSADFNTGECIGEAWIRKANGGAVTYIGSSPSSYWYEDTYWAVGAFSGIDQNPCSPTFANTTLGAYDAPTHSSYTCAGGIVFAGNLAVTQAHDNGYSSHISSRYYWEAYNVLGDPSLVPYFTEGEKLSVNHNPSIILGETSFVVGAPNGSLVALSKDGVLLGSALVQSNNSVNVTITPVATPGDVRIVVTRPQGIPVFATIRAEAPDGPYVVAHNCVVNDANKQADFGENFNISLTFENVGVDTAKGLTATLTGDDDFFTVVKGGPVNIGDILPDTIKTIDDVFSLSLADSVTDQYVAYFKVNVSNGDSTWTSNIQLQANSPSLSFTSIAVGTDDNSNGIIEVNESGTVKVAISNNGHSNISGVVVSLSNNSNNVTIGTGPKTINVAADSTAYVSFSVVANNQIEAGTDVLFNATATKGTINVVDSVKIAIGNKPIVYVGDGLLTNSTYYPFGSYYKANRTQMLYYREEVAIVPRVISKLGLNFTTIGAPSKFINLKIRLKEVAMSALGSSFTSISDGALVFSADTFIMPTASGWFEFDIDDFNFTGAGNLLVEISFGINSSWENNYYKVACTQTSDVSVNYGYDDSNAYPDYNGSCKIRPNLKLSFAAEPVDSFHVTFSVKDFSNNPVEGATVKVVAAEKTTDKNGDATFYLKNTAYSYWVSRVNHYTVYDNIAGVNADTTINIKLKRYNLLRFNVSDSGGKLEDVKISINGETISTDTAGFASLYVQNGTFNYKIVKSNYYLDSSSVTMYDADTTINVSMQLQNLVTLGVSDGSSAIRGAKVEIGNQVAYTNSKGVVSVYLGNGTYPYEVSRLGYHSVCDTIVGLTSDSSFVVNMRSMNNVSFIVSDGTSTISDATVVVADQVAYTNSNGIALLYLDDGTYTFTIKKATYRTVSLSDVAISADTTIAVRLDMLNKLTFSVGNATSAIAGAKVVVAGETIYTNGEGLASVYLDNGTYQYTISMDSYISCSDSVTIDGDDVEKRITLTRTGIEESVADDVVLYPNPFANVVSIRGNIYVDHVEVFNLQGQEVKNILLNGANTIEVGELKQGVYIFILHTNSGNRLIKKMFRM